MWDMADLELTVKEIVEAGAEFEARFFQQGELRGGFACQGDVVEFRSSLPLINAAGDIVASGEYDHWMVIGNTCDMERSEVAHSTIVPLVPIDATADKLPVLRSYSYYRQFYVPPWRDDTQQAHRMAMFVNPVTIEKKAFREDCARIVARLDFGAWALLHLCLIRFMARDDGRHD
ncbi:MAG TPA: hypothetical protein VFT22_00855 [Kofleriaceae bacterium]|nr:hypothetical protein [Kofleriaceae bacterium]